MTKPHDDDPLGDLRRIADTLGIPESPTPQQAGIHLDPADDLIAALKDRHGPLPAGTAAGDNSARARIGRRQRALAVAGAGIAAATIATVLVVQPWANQAAVADEPAVLDYEYAAAADIAHAPGRPAVATLRSLSEVASLQNAPSGGGAIQHIVTDNWFAELTDGASDSTEGQVIPTYRESWLAPDGSVTVLEHDGKPLSADGRTDASTARPSGTAVEVLPPGTSDAAAASTLPGDPAGLREAVLQRSGCPSGPPSAETAACLLQAVSDLHTTNVVPPELSAALWEVLATETDLSDLGTVSDRLGRDGVGISIVPPTSPQYRYVLIISEETGALLGTETILIREQEGLDLKAPAIFSFTAYVTTDYVDAKDVPEPVGPA